MTYSQSFILVKRSSLPGFFVRKEIYTVSGNKDERDDGFYVKERRLMWVGWTLWRRADDSETWNEVKR